MSGDRTDAVLQAIDGALDDWSVSGDAMRWTPPEPPAVEPIDWSAFGTRPPFADAVERPVFPAEWIAAARVSHIAVVGSAIRAACEAEAERLHRMLNPTPEVLDLRGQILRAFDVTPVEAGFEPDPKAHALQARRQRTTGPARPPAGRQKRPRHL